MKEIWKDVKGYEGTYKVSSLGRIKSLEREKTNHSRVQIVPETIKNLSVKNNGYLSTQLYRNNERKNKYAHRLVAEAFIADYSDNLQVNHIDMDKTNNKFTNLEMVNNAENHLHAHRFKSKKRGAFRSGNNWRAAINVDKKYRHIGNFKTKEEAYQAYRKEYIKLYGAEPW